LYSKDVTSEFLNYHFYIKLRRQNNDKKKKNNHFTSDISADLLFFILQITCDIPQDQDQKASDIEKDSFPSLQITSDRIYDCSHAVSDTFID
jgi:hypothetical protein